jgi:hypothetical protein
MIDFPDTPTVGQIVTGPNGQFQWDGTKWAPAGVASPLQINVQTFTASGTYTPTAGLNFAIVECVGGSGGGGGVPGTANFMFGGGGGGGGGYTRRLLTSAQVGASQSVTIGSGGAGGVGSAYGTAGGTTSFGALLNATGGGGGGNSGVGGYGGGTSIGGNVNCNGTGGGWGPYSIAQSSVTYISSGAGGSSVLGGGAAPALTGSAGAVNGSLGGTYGGGGSGGMTFNTTTAANGGAGNSGVCIVTEFIGAVGSGGGAGASGVVSLNGLTGAIAITGGTGITITPSGANIQVAATGVWSTGDVKLTYKTVADAGWVMMNDGSIGDASSGATTRANADTQNLFNLFFANCADADVPLQTSTGAATTRAAQGTAAAAWAAHCRMVLPKMLGRSWGGAGAGTGFTNRPLGSATGSETHTMTTAELVAHAHGINESPHTHVVNDPQHNHGVSDPSHLHGLSDPTHVHGISDPGHQHVSTVYTSNAAGSGSGVPYTSGGTQDNIGTWSSDVRGTGISVAYSGTGIAMGYANTGITIANHATGISINSASTGITTQNAGSGSPFSVMQPSSYLNVMVCL